MSNSSCQRLCFCVIALLLWFSTRAFASGVDTPTGVNNLPLNVEGVMGMTLVNENASTPSQGPVYIGVGTTAPQYPLDVSGIIAASGSAGRVALDSTGVYYSLPALQALTSTGAAGPLMINPAGGDVEIGMSGSPSAALDVNGAVLATNPSITSTSPGNGCTPEGMTAYDMNNHIPVYCSQGLVWTRMSPPQFTAKQVLLWSNCAQSEFTINLTSSNLSAYGIPSTATAIELSMYLDDGPGYAYYVNGYMDPTTAPPGNPGPDATDYNGKVCFGTANMTGASDGVGCAGTFLASPASHTFYQDSGGNDACALYIKGYYN